jgi:hypothetical protein
MRSIAKITAYRYTMKIAISTGVLFLGWLLYFLNGSSAERVSKTRLRQPATALLEPLRPALRITSITQHGRIFEIKGSTDPQVVVMINGQYVPTLFEENSFRHFVGPLPSGTSIITITAQDSKGGVNTQQMAFTTE